MKRLVTLTLLLCIPHATALARDPACSNHEGVSNLNPFGGRALNIIRKCVPLYCSATTKDPGTPDVLKHTDSLYTDLHKEVLAYDELVKQFAKVCRKLNGKICQDCPELAESQRLYPRIGMQADKVDNVKKSILDVSTIIDRMGQVEGLDSNRDPCLQDIKAQILAEMKVMETIQTHVGDIHCQPAQ